MENVLKGVIKTVLPIQSGESKATGKEWKKLTFVLANNEGYEGAEQIFAFEIFGAEKVENFEKYNKVGQSVDVSFNIKTNEYKEKYYTSLQAWKVFASSDKVSPQEPENDVSDSGDDMPF